MKTTQHQPHPALQTNRRSGSGRLYAPLRWGSAAVLGLLALAVAVPSTVQAQDHQVRAQPTRLTVQKGASGQITTTIYVIADTNDVVNLAVDNGSLPTGVTTATLNKTVFTAPSDDQLEDSATLTVNYTGTVPQIGANEIIINATGNYTYRLPVPINSAVIWNGDGTNNAWAGHWLPSNPSATDNVVFTSAGALPAFNDDPENVGFYTNTITNVVISSDQVVGGLRFSHGDESVDGGRDPDTRYRVEIKPGATLSVTGPGGFSMLQDTIDLPGAMSAEYFGGGDLVVSNSAGTLAMLKGFQQRNTLNLGGLNSFVADVNRVALGDYSQYPNYSTNGYEVTGGSGTNARPNRFLPTVVLAKSNYVATAYVGGEGVITNTENRDYAFTVSKTQTQATGSGAQFQVLFGVTNIFNVESIVFGAAGAKAENDDRIIFNTDTNVIPEDVTPGAYFRGADGTSRISVFTVADAANEGASGSGTKANVNLGGGVVNALVDVLYIGRDTLEAKDNDSAQGELTIGQTGTIFDANTVYVSAQELGNVVTNGTGDTSAEVFGTLNVQTGAVMKVNGTLHLGYTTAAPGDYRIAEEGNGLLSLDGGTVMANEVFVGGVTKVSVNNRISIQNGGELIVTNDIGQSDKRVNTLTMGDSTLTLFVDGTQSTPYVYVNQLVGEGAGNTIRLASVANIGSFPTQVELISYNSASPNFGVEMPPGYYGFILDNTANDTIDVVILNTPPSDRVWAGTPGTVWDTSAPNWQGGEMFVNGDTAQFDDTATSASVSLPSGTVFVGGFGVLVSNETKAYTFSGAGTIGGTAPMNKYGAASMAMNATSELPLTIHEGSVTGSGELGTTTVRTNTSLTFSGAVNRLTTSGTSTLSSSASVANGVTVKEGTLSNSGTINGTLNVQNEAAATVAVGGSVKALAPSTSSVGADASLVLNGNWTVTPSGGDNGNYLVEVSGVLTGTGKFLANPPDLLVTQPGRRARVNIASGGVFSPGAAPGDIVISENQGRFDFQQGSRVILDVDMASANGSNPYAGDDDYLGGNIWQNAKNSDVIRAGRWSTMTGTLVLTNTSASPYTNGTVLKLFKKPDDEYWKDPVDPSFKNWPDNENQLPQMEPASPGLGLIWDLSNFRTNGVVRILGTASASPYLMSTISQGTNLTFSWPAGYQGWELQTQVNPIDVGLSTNWTVLHVVDSSTNISLTITNWIDLDEGVRAYRMAHPEFNP